MECIILAAGKNERLQGMVAPYHKPLIVVNGKPLIVQLIEDCIPRFSSIILVLAPQNAVAVCSILTATKLLDQVHVVIQPDARGPGEALARGLRLVKTLQVMILCGDNIVGADALDSVLDAAKSGASSIYFGARAVYDREKAKNFTRLTPVTYKFEEGSTISYGAGGNGRETHICWIGPLVINSLAGHEVFSGLSTKFVGLGEIKIGSHLNALHAQPVPVYVKCYDIGLPEAVAERSKFDDQNKA